MPSPTGAEIRDRGPTPQHQGARLKKHLSAALVVAAAIPALWVSPAGAALPTKEAKASMACPDGVGTARVWYTISKEQVTKLAVDNPCAHYLIFSTEGSYASGAADYQWLVAPRAHFNWGKSRIAQYGAGGLNPGVWGFTNQECGGPTTRTVVSKYNDVRPGLDENGEGC